MKTGVIFSVTASALFALMPAYLQLLSPVHSFAVIGQRVLWSSIIITFFLLLTGQLKVALVPLMQMKNWPGLLAGALLIGSMWGLFVWGPMNGDTLGVALGFFLAPLVMVLVGLIIFKDHFSKLQYVATAVAILAVLLNLYNTGQFSSIAFYIAIAYPAYFILRRFQPIPILTAFYIENLILIPLAIWVCVHFGEVQHPFAYEPEFILLFFGLALLGSLGILCFLAASKRLPMALFGLLGYFEPFFIFLVALLVIGEAVRPGEGLTYLLIGLAIVLVMLDGLLQYLKQRNRNSMQTV